MSLSLRDMIKKCLQFIKVIHNLQSFVLEVSQNSKSSSLSIVVIQVSEGSNLKDGGDRGDGDR